MEKKRVLLISQPNLLSESLEHTLSTLEDVQLTCLWPVDEQVWAHIAAQPPDLVLIADVEPTSQQLSTLTSSLLEAHPNLPIFRIKLDANTLLIFTSQAIPARTADLVEAIRKIPVAGR